MKSVPHTLKLCLVLSMLLTLPLGANNLQLSNMQASTSDLSFDISWENSWNVSSAPNNWDAVWVIIKFQDCATETKRWSHLTLSTNNADHSITGGVLQVDAVSDGMGVFIRRTSTGAGNTGLASCTLTFSSAFSSITDLNFEVIGIEMVYVPQNSFYVGDGSTASPPLSQNAMGSSGASSPYLITSENAISTNTLANTSQGAPTNHDAIPAAFPKGYAAFYCMKYEISQELYMRFLNTLPATHQGNRTAVAVTASAGTLALAPAASPKRNAIRIEVPASNSPLRPAVYGLDLNNNGTFNEATDGANIACNYLSWYDFLALLDWAALRPMTELEYEKAARGPSSAGTPVLAAYCWNTTNILQADAGALNNAGLDNEVSTTSGNGLCAFNSANNSHGPLRTGFAATSISNREQSGASYYGIMELSGNVWEQCLHIGHSNGFGNGAAPIFSGVLGDGELDALGNANALNWGGNSNSAWRSIVRGGNWNQAGSNCQLSNRSAITGAGAENNLRNARTGGRGVRQP